MPLEEFYWDGYLETLEEIPYDTPCHRAGGGVVCDLCGKLYYDHTTVRVADTWAYGPCLLTRLCDGSYVKL